MRDFVSGMPPSFVAGPGVCGVLVGSADDGSGCAIVAFPVLARVTDPVRRLRQLLVGGHGRFTAHTRTIGSLIVFTSPCSRSSFSSASSRAFATGDAWR